MISKLQRDYNNSTVSSFDSDEEDPQDSNHTFYPIDKVLMGVTREPDNMMSSAFRQSIK